MSIKPMSATASVAANIRSGRQTQDRRPIRALRGFGNVTSFGKSDTPGWDWMFRDSRMLWNDLKHEELLAVAPWQKGDVLWVREPGRVVAVEEDIEDQFEWVRIRYRADGHEANITVPSRMGDEWDGNGKKYPYGAPDWVWKKQGIPNGIFREAARTFVEITDVRVERIQDISEEDARAEGVEPVLVPPDGGGAPHVEGFRALWDSIYAASGQGWDANPFVFLCDLKRTDKPEGWE